MHSGSGEVGEGERGREGEGGRRGRGRRGRGACQDLQCRFRICSDALVTIIKILFNLLGTVFGKEKRCRVKEKDMAFLKGSSQREKKIKNKL